MYVVICIHVCPCVLTYRAQNHILGYRKVRVFNSGKYYLTSFVGSKPGYECSVCKWYKTGKKDGRDKVFTPFANANFSCLLTNFGSGKYVYRIIGVNTMLFWMYFYTCRLIIAIKGFLGQESQQYAMFIELAFQENYINTAVQLG